MEKEYKLSCPDGFEPDAFWAYLGATPSEIEIHALYFDTQDELLHSNHAAFRFRSEGSKKVAAVKAKPDKSGEEGGFFARYEWETEADTWQEGLEALLSKIELPSVRDLLKRARQEGFIIQTETHFTRQFAPVLRGGTAFCAAFDRGTLGLAPPMPFSEVELELMSGPEEGLAEVMRDLSARFGLSPQRQSKLERALSRRKGRQGNGGTVE